MRQEEKPTYNVLPASETGLAFCKLIVHMIYQDPKEIFQISTGQT